MLIYLPLQEPMPSVLMVLLTMVLVLLMLVMVTMMFRVIPLTGRFKEQKKQVLTV